MDYEEHIKTVKIVSVVFTIIFIALILVYTLKESREETCYNKNLGSYDNSEVTNGIKLETDGYLLAKFPRIETDYEAYDFCYQLNSSESHKISIINEHETVVGRDSAGTDEKMVCSKITLPDDEISQYFGVRCDDCNSTNYLYVQKVFIGPDVAQITHNDTFVDDTPAYILRGFEGCSAAIKTFTYWYVTLMILLWLTVLAVMGFNKIKEVLFKGW